MAWRTSATPLVVLALAVAGCGGQGVDKQAYVSANARVVNAIPVFTGARLIDSTSMPYFEEGRSGAQGYTTNTRYRFPVTSTVGDVSAFYRRRLASRWKLTEVLRGSSRDGPVLNFCRGKASVSINLQSKQQRILEIDIDHGYYGKFGRPPSCTS